MKRRDTLLQHILAANLLLMVAVLFCGTLVATLDLEVGGGEGYRQFIVLTFGMVLVLLVNFLLLRRRFDPLERLIEQVEEIDPAEPGSATLPPSGGLEEVDRLTISFRRLLARIEAERNRSGLLVLRAQEAERKRIARDLHDEANQALAAITMRLEALAHDAPPELAADLVETKRLATRALDELLRLARQLRPAALDDHGLVPALDGQVRRFRDQTGIRARFRMEGEFASLDDDKQLVIYRVAQEALNNVARHSAATAVDVSLRELPGQVELSVADDGAGIADKNGGRRGLGLDGMAERARLVDGELAVRSSPGAGTEIELRLPA